MGISYKKALRVAAIEAYELEVEDTDMRRHIIGPGLEYETAEEWIRSRMESWVHEAMTVYNSHARQ
jgi:hypothetical protein